MNYFVSILKLTYSWVTDKGGFDLDSKGQFDFKVKKLSCAKTKKACDICRFISSWKKISNTSI